jgi:hypothetical protein
MITVVVYSALAAAAYRVMTVDERACAPAAADHGPMARDYGRLDLGAVLGLLRGTPAVQAPAEAALNVVVFIAWSSRRFGSDP